MKRARAFCKVKLGAPLTSLAALAACGGAPEPILVPPPPEPAPVASAGVAAPEDSLGPRPAVPPAAPPSVPTPEVLDGPGGSKIWLLSRPGLPLVSIAAVSRRGASSDPAGKVGVAALTAEMLEQGAGKLDAVAFTAALEEQGARLSSSASRDASVVSAHMLADRFPKVVALLCDAVARPRLAQADFARTHALFVNDVRARGDDPGRVAALVTDAALFGVDSPLGRPIEGTVASAQSLTRADVVAAHRAVWAPEQVTFVVVGDVTTAAVQAALTAGLEGWARAKASPEPAAAAALPTPPRVVAVAREDAPQVVMTVARRSLGPRDEGRAALELVALTLGGSFTSRLNQTLREDHGWTYGARARLAARRAGGAFVARASIRADALGDALRETRRVLDQMAEDGPTAAEIDKAKALSRGETVDTLASRAHTLSALVGFVALDLPPDTLGRDAARQGGATPEVLRALAKQVSSAGATIVLVGPSAAIDAAVQANALGAVERRDADGRPIAAR
ncbi:MAG: insulinase family protein [Polyangiaceae bacterium]|nr:insulinase family protein [Polyangiaceae bacterium]